MIGEIPPHRSAEPSVEYAGEQEQIAASVRTSTGVPTRGSSWPGNCDRPAKGNSMYDTEDTPLTAERDTSEGGSLDFSSFMQRFADDMKGYVHAQRRYLTLHLTEKVSILMGKVMQQMVLFVALGMALLFLNIALALYLGDLLASRPLGFVVVAGFYLLLLGIFSLWWSNGGKDRFVIDRINDLNDNDD